MTEESSSGGFTAWKQGGWRDALIKDTDWRDNTRQPSCGVCFNCTLKTFALSRLGSL